MFAFNSIFKENYFLLSPENYFLKRKFNKPFHKTLISDGKFIGKFSYGYLELLNSEIGFKYIGHFCSIAPNVKITNMNHPIDFVTTNPVLYHSNRGFCDSNNEEIIYKKNNPIVIKNDV